MTRSRRRLWLPVIAPIAALTLCAFFGAIMLAMQISAVHDRAAAARETRLLARSLLHAQSQLNAMVREYAEWDDAYENVVLRFNKAWVATNFFPTSFDHLAIVTPDGRVLHERSAPEIVAAGSSLNLAQALGPRLRSWAERARAAGGAGVTGFDRGPDGHLLVIAAQPIRPSERPGTDGNSYLAFTVNALSPGRVTGLQLDTDIQDLRFRETPETGASETGFYAVSAPDGAPLGAFQWREVRPGADALLASAPIWAVFFLALGAAMALAAHFIIGERIRADALARERAEQASAAKSRFLANISHELRTPLNAVIGYAEILMEDPEVPAQSHAQKDIRRIHGAAQQLLALIGELLDMSKAEAGKLEAVLDDVDFDLALSDVAALAQPLLQKSRNSFHLANRSGLAVLRTDARLLRQILLNLLSNAAKFTYEGAVSLEADWRDAATLLIRVRDTGIGMTAEQIALLFDPFVQADPTISHRYGGTGLGLALSRRLAELLGGAIEVQSAPGAGSTFTLVLPLSPPAEATAAQHALAAA